MSNAYIDPTKLPFVVGDPPRGDVEFTSLYPEVLATFSKDIVAGSSSGHSLVLPLLNPADSPSRVHRLLLSAHAVWGSTGGDPNPADWHLRGNLYFRDSSGGELQRLRVEIPWRHEAEYPVVIYDSRVADIQLAVDVYAGSSYVMDVFFRARGVVQYYRTRTHTAIRR